MAIRSSVFHMEFSAVLFNLVGQSVFSEES